MPITTLPVPPTRADPANFATRADAFLSALPLFVTEANNLAYYANQDAYSTAADVVTTTAQAGIATTQAAAAAASAAAAFSSEGTATTQAGYATVAFLDIDSKFLGSKASDPTVNNQGGALVAGASYWNSSVGELRYYTGSAWATQNIVVANYMAKTGDETIAGVKTFSSTIVGSINGNAATVTNGVYTTGAQSIAGLKTFTASHALSIANSGTTLAVTQLSTGSASIYLHRTGAYAVHFGLDTDNQLAVGGGTMGAVRRRIYTEGNVVGTAAQVGGIPTGAIIETGTNANGRYIRWADGTQICYYVEPSNRAVNTAIGPIFISAVANFNFPAAFSVAPVVRPMANNSSVAPCWSDNSGPTTTTTGPIYAFAPQNTATTAVGYIAFGRWY